MSSSNGLDVTVVQNEGHICDILLKKLQELEKRYYMFIDKHGNSPHSFTNGENIEKQYGIE